MKVKDQYAFVDIKTAQAQGIALFIVLPVIFIETDFPTCVCTVLSLTYIALYPI